MNRSSARLSSLNAVISPGISGTNDCRDSSRRVPPMRAFRSITFWMTSSVGPTWATVTPPALDPPDASRCTGRFLSGSISVAAPKNSAGGHGQGARALTTLEREEIHAAARGQDVGDLPVFVHSDRVTRRRLPPCSRRAIAPDIGRGGRLEESVPLGGDDEEEGENAGDDDDTADHHEPGRPPVKEDTPAHTG